MATASTKENTVQIRLTDDQRRTIAEAAEPLGLTLASYIRMSALAAARRDQQANYAQRVLGSGVLGE